MRSDDMKDDEILRQYLLGDLEARQADELEQRLLREEDLFELAEAVEADLLDSMARGELSAAERGRIRRRLAKHPGGRARLALVSGLIAATRQEIPIPPEVKAFRLLRKPWVRAAAVAASLLVVPGALWLGMQTLELGGAVIEPPRHKLPPWPFIDNSPLVLELALTTVRSESGVPAPLTLSERTRSVEIRLPLGPDDPSTPFAVTLRDAESQEAIQQEELTARRVDGGRALVLSVPADRLTPGTYEVEVRTTTAEGSELFGKPIFEVASTNHPSSTSNDGIP